MATKLSAKDLRFEQKARETITKGRQANVPDLPEEYSSFTLPEVEDYFKMMAVLETGTTIGWEKYRDQFIGKVDLPNSVDLQNQTAAMLQAIVNKELSNEDMIMNDFAQDTNEVINMISEGTVDVDSGAQKLDKMQILEGNMPGQGKEKQGNWRG
jgi:hypothetical protein